MSWPNAKPNHCIAFGLIRFKVSEIKKEGFNPLCHIAFEIAYTKDLRGVNLPCASRVPCMPFWITHLSIPPRKPRVLFAPNLKGDSDYRARS